MVVIRQMGLWTARLLALVGAVALLVLGLSAIGVQAAPVQTLARLLRGEGFLNASSEDGHEHGGHDDHEGHDHGADDADKQRFVDLSLAARKTLNPGFTKLSRQRFEKMLNIPAVLSERSGQSEIDVAAPVTGIVTKVHVLQGESVSPGQPLFDLRVTHADLVVAQTTFLGALEQLDVTQREVQRLQKLADQGTVPAQRLLQIRYEEEQLLAKVKVERQALVLHGLSKEQVARIESERNLLPQLTISTPPITSPSGTKSDVPALVAEYLKVTPGAFVQAGTQLAILSDHSELYIEGRAFEYDAEILQKATQSETELSALFHNDDGGTPELTNLKMLFLSSRVEAESHTLHFYIRLPNVALRMREEPSGHRWVDWKYRPGRHLSVRVPIEVWNDQLVLPVSALVTEGTESFVFRRTGLRFERCRIVLKHRDMASIVLGEGSEVQPGDTIVTRGADQLQLALKLQTGGGGGGHSHDH